MKTAVNQEYEAKRTITYLGPKVTQFDYKGLVSKYVDLEEELSQKYKDLILAYDDLDRIERTKKVCDFMNLDKTHAEIEYMLLMFTLSHW